MKHYFRGFFPTHLVLLIVFYFCSCHNNRTIQFHTSGETTQCLFNQVLVAEIVPRKPSTILTHTTITEKSPEVYALQVSFYNPTTKPTPFQEISIDVSIMDSFTYAMIPAVNYNGNTWGQGLEPKGFDLQDTPWVYAAHRTAIPGATYSEDPRRSWALFADYKAGQLSSMACSIEKHPNRRVHRLIIPAREYPLVYANRDQYRPALPPQSLSLAPGDSLHLQAWLVTEEITSTSDRAWKKWLDLAWEMILQKPSSPEMTDTIWQRGITYASQSLWAEEGSYRGFSIGLIWKDSQWIQRPGWKYEIGWCGQNASLANSLLVDYQKTGRQYSLDQALACLDTWSENTILPNGLFRTHYDYILGIAQGQERLDACNLGTAALNFFEAAHLARQAGHPRDHLRTIALDLCTFMANDQEPSGRYGKAWSVDGHCLDREGTIGAFLIPPMVKAFVVTGDSLYYHSSVKAHAYYFGEYKRNGYTSAGALDTYCIDKESAISLLRSALILYQLSAERTYLDEAVAISYYLSTWLWHYHYPYADSTEFKRYNWSTLGGTAVSVQHHHLDPYALLWVPEWLELAELTGEVQWKEKAQAIWFNGCQLIADGRSAIHGRIRPRGAQNEAYFQTDWSGTPGSFNDWLVAWPTAFRLETLRKVSDWSELYP